MRLIAGRHQVAASRVPGAVTTLLRARPAAGPQTATPGRGGQHRPGAPGVTGADETTLTGRALRTLAGVFVITWSFRLSGYLTFGP